MRTILCFVLFCASLANGVKWPRGYWGLTAPKDGCPTNTNQDFPWRFGQRRHDTEDGNEWSVPLSFYPEYAKKNMDQSFCMKTTWETSGDDNWPAGSFCVFKARKQECPVGFYEGWVFWDDRDIFNRNDLSGECPDGEYGEDTLIRYCCRDDGPASNPILLPNEVPFYLLRYGGQCQEVSGMLVSEEWFRWRCNTPWPNTDASASYRPDGEYEKHALVRYCYYVPEYMADMYLE